MKKVFGIATIFILVFLFSGIYLVQASMAQLWMGKIKNGETISSPYRGFNVSITYASADPQNVLVSVNGNIVQEIKKDVSDRDGKIILNFENLYLKLYPLAPSDSLSCNQPPCYTSTDSWNTSVLAFEVGPTNAPYPPYQDIRGINEKVVLSVILILILIAIVAIKKKARK